MHDSDKVITGEDAIGIFHLRKATSLGFQANLGDFPDVIDVNVGIYI